MNSSKLTIAEITNKVDALTTEIEASQGIMYAAKRNRLLVERQALRFEVTARMFEAMNQLHAN